MLLGTLGASLLGNLLTAKNTIRAGERAFNATPPFNKFWNKKVSSKWT